LALQRTTSAHGAVIIASLPLVTAVFAVMSHGERVPSLFWVGAIAGALTLSTYAWLHGGSDGADFTADVLLVSAVLASAFGYSEGARLTRIMPGWQVVSWCVVLYLPFSLVAATTTVLATRLDHVIKVPSVLALLFVSFGSMYLGFFAWYRGLADLGIARGSQVQMIQPMLTLLWSALIIREDVPIEAILAAAVVIVCVGITQKARRTPRVARET
jgi:drug/metabolite transporter (DMT)-like permease